MQHGTVARWKNLFQTSFWKFSFLLVFLPQIFNSNAWSGRREHPVIVPMAADITIVERDFYSLAYSEKHEQAKWVQYELTKDMLQGQVPRSDDFRRDPRILTETASSRDYKRSGFHRGHLVPAGDMKTSLKAMSDTFYYSNISPQRRGFNLGIWKKLEEKVRSWAKKYGHLEIVAGPILKPGLDKIHGPVTDISIPQTFFKIIRVKNQKSIKSIAFLIPHYDYGTLEDHIHSIDEIERRAGVDFFTHLPRDIERKIEAQVGDLTQW